MAGSNVSQAQIVISMPVEHGVLVEVFAISARHSKGQLEADEAHISSAPVQATRLPCQDPGRPSASISTDYQ